jgi:general secretion pathway protein K
MHKFNGSALLTALFIITIVAIVTTAMTTRLSIDIQRTTMIDTTDRLQLASQAVTFWAMDRLGDPKQTFKNLDATGKVLEFPNKLSGMYPGAITHGALYDLQSRFNLNNVADKTFLPMYLGVLEQVLPNSDSQVRAKLIDATVNWIQGHSKTHVGHDEWLDQYLKQKPVYFPSYQYMQHASELRLVLGVTAEIYRTLTPYITALPEITPINLNTAPLPLLRALGDGISEHDAEEILKLRSKKTITNLAELGPLSEKLHIPAQQITLVSQYFLVVVENTLGDHHLTYATLLKRTVNKQGQIHVSILNAQATSGGSYATAESHK